MPGTAQRFWSPWRLAAAALSGITLAFYHGLWLPDQILIERDAYRFFLPIKGYMVERLSAWELPQWFPYDAMGRPFIGATATGVFHPFTALYFLFSVPDAYRASSLLSCLLAALGAFTLGRTLKFSPAGSLVAGVAFALSGYVVSVTDNIQYLYSICVLPLFCAALERALTGSRAWTVAPAVVWATVFLNGDTQTGYYFGFIALLWAAMRMPAPRREGLVRLAIIGGLAVLLAGVQLGPGATVFMSSDRARPALFHEQAMAWSTHPLRLVTMLASPIGGDANPLYIGRFFFSSPNHGLWAQSLYFGVPVLGLALIGAWQRRDLRVLALLGGFALLLALGRFGGLYEVFYQVVPLWSVFRYPEKLMGVVSFAVAMLAGAGLDALRAGRGPTTAWLATALLCAGLGLGLGTEFARAWTAERFGAPEALAAEMTGSAAHAFLCSSGAALGVWMLVAATRRQGIREAVLIPMLAILLTFDLARANMEAYHVGPAEAATFVPPLVEALQAREGALAPGRFRLISLEEANAVTPEPLVRAIGFYGAGGIARRQALDLEHNAQFHIEMPQYYLPGLSAAFAALLEQKPGTGTAARYNVAYYIGRRHRLQDPLLAHTLVAELPDYDLALFQNPVPAKPRAYLSLQPEPANSPVDPAMLLARTDFLNGTVDVIETSGATLPGPATGGRVTIERYAPEEARIRVEAAQPGVLVLLDAFDTGWRASLENGLEIPIMRANALVRAVVVPAGDHVVTFRYTTPLLHSGAAASLAGLFLCVRLVVAARRERRMLPTSG